MKIQCNLSDLKIGQKGRVLRIEGTNRAIKRHLLDMGVTKGSSNNYKKNCTNGRPY